MNLLTNVSYKVTDVYNNNEIVEQKKKEKDCIIILDTNQYIAINQKLNFYIKKLSEMKKYLETEEILLINTKIELYAESVNAAHSSVKTAPVQPNKYEVKVLNYMFATDIDRPFGIHNNFKGYRERRAKEDLEIVPEDLLDDYMEKYSW